MAKWLIKNSQADFEHIAKQLNVPLVVAKLIVNRGFKTYGQALDYLNPKLNTLPSAFGILDMDKAIDTLKRHLGQSSKIAIYGDYDVDGVMSAVILSKCLKQLNADYIYYVPDREKEGYGLNAQAVEQLNEQNVDLIIACDNGISAIAEAEMIYKLGMELIIIDHHEPTVNSDGNDILPKAEAVIDPKRKDCTYSFKYMCAAGLCYRFSEAFLGQEMKEPDELLNFAAIATVCDIVDLLADNRVIVKTALDNIMNTKNAGLKALIQLNDLKHISAYHLGFIIGPTINASGRLESAVTATELFMTEDYNKAQEIAARLHSLNQVRRTLTEDAFVNLKALLQNEEERKKSVYVLYDDNIHESVAGIVAGRIKENFHHPTIVITKGSQYAKGSARSIESYNMFEALSSVSHLFVKFGGHSQAAGLTIAYENIDKLRDLLNKNCTLDISDFEPVLRIESRLAPDEATLDLYKAIQNLEPFGKANKEPMFAEKNVRLCNIDFIGRDKNIIKMQVKGVRNLSVLSFDGYEKFLSICKEKLGTDDKQKISAQDFIEMDIAFTVNLNEFRGEKNLQLHIKDFR